MKYILLFLFCFGCTSINDGITISKFDLLSHVSSQEYKGETIKDKYNYYLVENYKDNSDCDSAIVNFVKAQKRDTAYKSEYFTFYRLSDITNEAHLKENPRDLDRYSADNDLLFQIIKYQLPKDKNNPNIITKYRNGEMVGERHVKVMPLDGN